MRSLKDRHDRRKAGTPQHLVRCRGEMNEVRAILCPDKVTADEWIEVMRCAHGVGLRTTSTIMFGHVDQYRHWARHLLRIRALQEETGGFTELVPLPFVHMEAPIRSEKHTSELPSLMRISSVIFCLQQNKTLYNIQ